MQDSRIGRRLMGDVPDRAAKGEFAGVPLVQAAAASLAAVKCLLTARPKDIVWLGMRHSVARYSTGMEVRG